MAVKERARYAISAAQLGSWLRNQGPDSWWSVDGDPVLTGRIAFPAPGPEIADVLVKMKKRLLFLDLEEEGHVRRAGGGERVLQFSWEEYPQTDWLLIEDMETAENSKKLATNHE